jgi:hypothetical protein
MKLAFEFEGSRRVWIRCLCLVLLPLALLSSAACSSNERAVERATPIASMPAERPSLLYDVPEQWIKETPSSRLRQAQYRVPRAEGDPEDAELAVFYFGGQAGSVQGNIDRWVGQFRHPDGSAVTRADEVSTKETNGIFFTIVEVNGTYNQATGPMMGGGEVIAKPNFRMLAAIAETSSGPWFFKLTGPEKTVETWEEEFDAFLETVRPPQQSL